MKIFKTFLFFLWAALPLSAQTPHNETLGSVKKVAVKGQEYTFTTTKGIAKVIVYSPDVIRIRIEKSDFAKTFSYAVVADPLKCKVNSKETATEYTLATDSLTLRIHKNPLRFAFYTNDNKLINTDDPAFGTSWLGEEVTTYKSLQDGERFIGLGEHGGNLDRRGESFVNWNTDNPGYDNGSESLYASIPFYIGLHHQLSYGIFLDNSSRTIFNFGAANDRFASFSANCGEMDYYFIYHSSVKKIIESYTWLTGRTPLPPLWSLGYQQCRYSYFPDKEVYAVAHELRDRKIPADMIYLDIHYMDHYKLFTWDSQRFPNPSEMIDSLKKMSFHTAVIIDPGVKVEDHYNVYTDGLKSDIFIKYPDGTNFTAQVWPGWCNFPDFTMPKAREWWGNWVKTYADAGVTGFWNDMNEIAAWGKDVPRLMDLNWEGKGTTYREAKNVYGMEMARSTYEGAKKSMNGKRPFVLTRAGYAGLQRYTAIWTGDNHSNDDHMLLGVRLLNSMGISGISFTGMDIGGFSGNPTSELYTRWMELGAFLPMFRQHTAIYTNRAEPWAFGEISEDIARRYTGFRYQLLPYLYSNFYQSATNGMPVVRSLAIDYPFDQRTYDAAFQQQFLFGPSLMVAPMRSTETIGRVFLPEGNWYDLFTDSLMAGNREIFTSAPLNKLPLFVKAGSIIPMQRLVESTTENPGDTLYIHIYSGTQPNRYVYYEDDGVSYDYNNGKFYKRTISYRPAERRIEFDPREGTYDSKFKIIRLVFHGYKSDNLSKLIINGTSGNLHTEALRFFSSRFPFADYGPDDTKQVLATDFMNSGDRIVVTW